MIASRVFVAGALSACQPHAETRHMAARVATADAGFALIRPTDSSEGRVGRIRAKPASAVTHGNSPLMVAIVFSVLATFANISRAETFDQQHKTYAQVLESHVQWNEEGTASTVDYEALKAAPDDLNQYLEQLSGVKESQFNDWSRDQQLAFLINAYNAFTLKLIVDHYPVDSIRDIGTFWQNPWKMRFFILLGEEMHLDQVEHEIIRKPGVYNEPRIHFAVNCASVGCPALRTEPFTAEQLEQQLEDSTERFLQDETRNRYRHGRLEVSSIFKWYREDFERGWQGINSLDAFFLRYANSLGLSEAEREQLREGAVAYRFLDYDWRLNSRDGG